MRGTAKEFQELSRGMREFAEFGEQLPGKLGALFYELTVAVKGLSKRNVRDVKAALLQRLAAAKDWSDGDLTTGMRQLCDVTAILAELADDSAKQLIESN